MEVYVIEADEVNTLPNLGAQIDRKYAKILNKSTYLDYF